MFVFHEVHAFEAWKSFLEAELDYLAHKHILLF